jgi:curved DNA-binding protein CbpA
LPGASPADIRRAYRKLILIHHPDRGGDPAVAKKVINAYRLLREQNGA